MKKNLLLVNRLFWLVMAVAINVMVVLQWREQGCNAISLVVGLVWFSILCWAFYKVIDNSMKGD